MTQTVMFGFYNKRAAAKTISLPLRKEIVSKPQYIISYITARLIFLSYRAIILVQHNILQLIRN